MESSGEYPIQAPRAQVWDALNDPDILRETLPGCEALEQTGENRYTARIKSAIGPVSAIFDCRIELSHINPPFSYTLSGKSDGAANGSVDGSADVTLDEDGPHTILRYLARFEINGRLARTDPATVNNAVRTGADEFFDNFAGLVNAMAILDSMDHEAVSLEEREPAVAAATASAPPVRTAEAKKPPAPLGDAGESSRAYSSPAGSSGARSASAGSGGSVPWLWLGIGAVLLIVLWLLMF